METESKIWAGPLLWSVKKQMPISSHAKRLKSAKIIAKKTLAKLPCTLHNVASVMGISTSNIGVRSLREGKYLCDFKV